MHFWEKHSDMHIQEKYFKKNSTTIESSTINDMINEQINKNSGLNTNQTINIVWFLLQKIAPCIVVSIVSLRFVFK